VKVRRRGQWRPSAAENWKMTIGQDRQWRALLVACALLALPSIRDPGGRPAIGCYLLGLALIGGGLLLGLRRMPASHRSSWGWIGAGALSAVVGSACWELPISQLTVQGVAGQDLFWLSVYPLILRGVFLRIAARGSGPDVRRAVLLDMIVVTSAATVVAWHLLIGPALGLYASAGPLVTIVAVAYPLGDVSMFALGAALLIAPTRHGVPDALLVAALGLELPMDVVSALLVAHAPGVGNGWYRAGYLLVNGMIAAAVLYPRTAVTPATRAVTESGVHGWRLLMLGTGLSGIALSTIFMPEAGWHRLPVAAAVVATLAAILLRFHRAVRALESAERRLHHEATHDQLTGVANRTLLLTELNAAVRETALVLIFVDLDGFKLINDSYGHHVGDEVLLAVTRRLSSSVRSGDLVARLGGDEFVVVCRGVKEADVEPLADRIDSEIRQPLAIGGRQLTVGASVGVTWPHAARAPASQGKPSSHAT
jgi:diguanylate cyclase (GGDEF)-like protein